MLLDVTYKGLCINGPNDGDIMYYDGPVVRVSEKQRIPALLDPDIPQECSFSEYFYEEFLIDGERFGFWMYEGTTHLEAFRALYERYNTE